MWETPQEPKNETAFALQRELEQLARELANVQNKEEDSPRRPARKVSRNATPREAHRPPRSSLQEALNDGRASEAMRTGPTMDEPCLVNICDDPLLSGCLRYSLPANHLVHIGSSSSCQIHVDGLGIQPERRHGPLRRPGTAGGLPMCSVVWRPGHDVEIQVEAGGQPTRPTALHKIGPPKVLINGQQVSDYASLRTGDVLQVGHGHMFQLLSQPSRQACTRAKPREGQLVDAGVIEDLEVIDGSDLIWLGGDLLHQNLGSPTDRPSVPEIVVALRAQGGPAAPLLTVWSIEKFKEKLEAQLLSRFRARAIKRSPVGMMM
eukprot:g16225.t1